MFIDEEQLAALEKTMAKRGYLDGAEMATSFNLLRASDLIWSFVINNYLLGKDPFPFDLLYWNSDNTRMPAAMHSFYLRKCYYENVLVRAWRRSASAASRSTCARIDLPVYWVSTKEDHIAPWKSTYAATQLYQGPKTVRAGRLGPHRRRGQPAGLGQVRLLAQRRAAGRPGSLVRRCPAS